jgi:hypothetical protein
MRRRGLSGSFWPSRRQENLLRLALDPGLDVRRAWRELQPLQVETLEEGTFALLPLVYRRLHKAGVQDERLPRLAGTYRSTWVRNQLQLDRLPFLLEPLRDAGMEPIVTGGAVIAKRYYPQVGLRPILQLELFVAAGEATRAGSLLGQHGWPIDGRSRGRTTRVVEEDGRVAALLYEGVPEYVRGPVGASAAFAALVEQAADVELDGTRARTLAPFDELLLACALGARKTYVPGIQWLVDVHHILVSGEADTERLAARARAQHLTAPLRDAIRYLERTTGLEAPQALVTASVGARERVVHRLAGNGLGMLGPPPDRIVEYARATLDESPLAAARGLPGALRDAWGLDGIAKVPAAAARKIASRARRGQPPRRDRSRSASS